MLNHLMSYSYYYDYGYDDYSSSYSSAGAGLAIGVILLIWLFTILGVYLLTAIPMYKIFKKAGKKGWEAFVPIYNLVVELQIVNINPIWILLVLVPGVGSLCMTAINIFAAIRLCKGFGKDTGFIVGYVLLTLIFQFILAFDSSTWDASRIDMNSLSFLNKDKAPAPAAANGAPEQPTAAANATTTPEDPWVSGNDQPQA
jgi:hypothetical protein